MPSQLQKSKKASRPNFVSRALTVRMDASGKPSTLDDASRSVGVVASTEDPAWVWDYDRWESVPEVLLMSGCRMPSSGRCPLLDSHSRYSVDDVLGSFKDFQVVDGDSGPELQGRAYFSKTSEDAWIKTSEGHVTDVSIGYEIHAHSWIEEGSTSEINGRTFTGPLRVVSDWSLFELSLCPIGADSNAKTRNAPGAAGNKETAMPLPITGGDTTAKKRSKTTQKGRSVESELAANELPEDQDETLDPVDDPEFTDDEARSASEDDEENEESSEESRKKRSSDPRVLERKRIQAITAACRHFGFSDTETDKLIDSGISVRDAKARILDMYTKSLGTPQGFNPTATHGASSREKFSSAAQGALFLRCGLNVDLKDHPGAESLRSYSLRELARECLIRAGERIGNGDINSLVGRALTTTDLPSLLVETSRRTLVDAYAQAPETWPEWCAEGQVTDFKLHEAISMDAALDLDEILENDEYKIGKLGASSELYQVDTFGKKLVISRKAIINDDLSALTAVPRLFGEAAARKVGDVAYQALLSNPNMGDGNPLFGAPHANLYTGRNGVPTVQNLGAIVTGMEKQKSPLGIPLAVLPQFFLAPLSLKVAAEQFFNTQLNGGPIVSSQAAPILHNPYGGEYFKRIYERRLDLASEADWYLLGAMGKTVTVFFLNGMKEPYLEVENGFDVDGIQCKVRIDAGAKAMSWYHLAKAVSA